MGALNLLPLSLLSTPRPATDAEYARWLRASQMPGAPADFGGAVFPNPDNVQISDDTDSGIPVTRLPDGVKFERGAWHGSMPGDVSNPPKAQISTSAAKSSAAPIDFSKYDAQGAKVTPKVDFSEYDEKGAKTAKSDDADLLTMPLGEALDREIPLDSYRNATLSGFQSIGRAARDFGKGLTDLVKPPENAAERAIAGQEFGKAALPLYRVIRGMGHTIADSLEVTDAIKDINASPDPTGAYAKALQQMSAEGAVQALTAAASEGLIRGIPKVSEALPSTTKLTAPVRAAVKGANTVLKKAPGTVGASAGAAAGGYFGGHLGAEIGGGAGALLGKELLPEITIPGESVGLPKRIAGGPANAPAYTEPAPIKPGEAEPFEGVTSPQTEGAGDVVEQGSHETPAQVLTRSGTTAELEKALNNALGGKPLQKGVPLRSQVPGKAPAAPALPEDFTPVESKALRGYKYDPVARELEYITKDGQHYVRGDVAPEAVAKFEANPSAGKGMHALRQDPQGGVGTFKVINGKRVPVRKGPISASPEGEVTPLQRKVENLQDFIRPQKTLKDLAKPTAPTAAAAEPDLLTQLEQSRDQALAAKRSGITTTAKPSDLLDRWGVDPKSFAEGREQTRGMSPEDSAAAIDKIADSYKQGQKPEPVIEVRDADNNVIEVDGRSRVLAAHKAGIKRIPIIVRRLQ